jgi:preprotein translocase subunit SecG
METILIGVHLLAAIGITGLVLMQHGKGADMGASFGSGASQTMFGSSGSGNFLGRSTTWLTVIFFVTSLGLAIVAKQRSEIGVQDSSLISGDIEQINNELRINNQQDIPSVSADSADSGEIPVVTADDGEIPVVDEATEGAAEVVDEAQGD